MKEQIKKIKWLAAPLKAVLRFWLKTRLAIRMALPYPRFWSRISNTPVPLFGIVSKRNGLNRPEAISFTRSGDLMSVSNSGNSSVVIYKSSKEYYAKKPVHSIEDDVELYYVHDAVISDKGDYLGTVSRESDTLVVYQLTENSEKVATQRIQAIKGSENGIDKPGSLSIHPSGDWLIVANRTEAGLSVYEKRAERFSETPVQIVRSEPLIEKEGIATPHGIDFSKDGKFLAVVSKRWPFAKHTDVVSALSVYRWNEKRIAELPEAFIKYGKSKLHGVAFNEEGNKLALAIEMEGIHIIDFDQETMTFGAKKIIRVSYFLEGVKGIAFVPGKKTVVVSTDLDELLFYEY